MGADRLLLIPRALALKSLVFSILAVVDVIVGAFAIPNLVMTERHDARMRHGLLAGSERIAPWDGPTFARAFAALMLRPRLIADFDVDRKELLNPWNGP